VSVSEAVQKRTQSKIFANVHIEISTVAEILITKLTINCVHGQTITQYNHKNHTIQFFDIIFLGQLFQEHTVDIQKGFFS
jgi:hypothetical protein